MAADPTAAYRKQQGMAPVTQSYDPVVVGWVVKAAKQTGADPAALLATAIQESGARVHPQPGDAGTSFGPFQFHRGGALGSHSPAWASTYAAALDRAREFARLQVHGGPGAAAVQRPADRSLYATGVNSHLAQAKAILAHYGLEAPAASPPVVTPPAAADTPTTPVIADRVIPGHQLVSTLFDGTQAGYVSPLQSILDQNAKLADIPSITLPVAPVTPTPATTTTLAPPGVKPTPAQQAAHSLHPTGRVTTIAKPKIIGTPGVGTHAVSFNRQGGSDNWESERAVDIALPKGTPIYAPTSGVIGPQIGSLGSGGRFAGLRVHLNGGGNEFYFAHLSRLAVQAGQKVRAGQLIGYSGVANGVAHLHLATKSGNPGTYA